MGWESQLRKREESQEWRETSAPGERNSPLCIGAAATGTSYYPTPPLRHPSSDIELPMSNPQSSQCPPPPNMPSSPMSSAMPSPEGGESPRAAPKTIASTPPFPSPVSRTDHIIIGINPSRNLSGGEAPDPTKLAAESSEITGPSKIPFRPRKTRKLAAKQEADEAGAEAALEGAIMVAEPIQMSHQGRYRLPPRPLSAQGEVAAAIGHLRSADPQLARIIDAHQLPVFQSLHPPFHSLARSILYQQLAFKAAASIYSRFLALCGGEDAVLPEVVLGLGAHQLRQIGVSARKASYLHDLANKYRSGILSDSSIVGMDDKSLFTMLNMVKGIGAWSVHMFMIFSLHRPDVLPVGDVGVRKGVQLLYGLDALPRPSQMEQLCENWKPYRSVGAWYMWRLVEAKGMPAALATASSPSIGHQPLPNGGTSPVMGIASTLQPHLPPHLHRQQNHQTQQHQHQLQMQSQLVDVLHGIPNLG